ncbi:MAG: hypothetical protein JNJ59_25090 [Deltaproteobacteria bacterium]|jgi:hypothetical protein|nr:hypothetical protein [Deltaproteobacteria bacterium]
MSATETFEVELGASNGGLLTPGRILRALALGARVASEDVTSVTISGHATATVEIALQRSAFLGTPRLLPCEEGGRPALFVLRRPDDPTTEALAELLITAEDGAPIRPTELSALADLLGLGVDELGFGLAGSDFVRLTVPLAVAPFAPKSFTSGTRSFRAESLAKKR